MNRNTGCSASAIVDKIGLPNGQTVELEPRFVLTSCSKIEDHNHEGDFATVVSEVTIKTKTLDWFSVTNLFSI